MDYDIIIIGGGPGGLSTALHLQRIAPHLASRVLILEKARYPRFKLCAGGITLDAEIILQRLGLDVSEVPHVDAENIHFDFEGQGLNIHIPNQHALRVIRRDEFDNWLAKKVESRGVEIREGVSVKNIITDKDGVTIETDGGTFRAQVIVGADGSNGITRRCIFPNAPVYTARVLEVVAPEYNVIARRLALSGASYPERSETKTKEASADEAQAAGQSPPKLEIASGRGLDTPNEHTLLDHRPRNDMHKNKDAYFEFFPVPNNIAGYVWDFPTQIKGEPMRCWGIYDTNILANGKRPQLKEPLAKEMSRLGFNLDDYEIKGRPIRWFSPENQMSVPRVLLVGDAAGADPLLGEGISIALGYGALAAREISESFQCNDFSFRRYRRRVVRSALGQALIARWALTHIVYPFKWKWFQFLLWRIAKPIVISLAWVFVLNWGKRMQFPSP